jgi:hypothetical protein
VGYLGTEEMAKIGRLNLALLAVLVLPTALESTQEHTPTIKQRRVHGDAQVEGQNVDRLLQDVDDFFPRTGPSSARNGEMRKRGFCALGWVPSRRGTVFND